MEKETLLELTNLTKKRLPKKFFENLAARFWRVLKQPPRPVSLVLVGDKKMKELNYRYRRKYKVTDVLSFGYQSAKGEPSDKSFFGEIFICLPQAARQAPLFYPQAKAGSKALLKLELARLFYHGLLHLAGYDHERLRDAKKMFALADKMAASYD